MQEDDWFEIFEKLEDTLVQGLILIAILHAQEIIQEKESTLMKKYLLTSSDKR